MKKNALIGIAILFLLFWTTHAETKKEIRIGSPLLLSGTGAYVGEAEKETLEMLAENLNRAGGIDGRPIRFIFYDEEAKPDVAVSVVKRLIHKDKVTAIVGISTSWTALPVIPIVQKAQIPTIMLSSSIKIVEPVSKWVFKTPIDERIVVARLLDYIKDQNIRRIAVMSSQDGFGNQGRNELIAQSPGNGIQVVFDDKYTMEDTDVTPTINKIKKTDAQAVVNWSSERAPIIFTMNYRQMGLALPLFHSHAVLSKEFLEVTGKNAEGIIAASFKFYEPDDLPDADPQKKVLRDYQAEFREIYGKEANQFGACAFDAFHILVAALKKAGDDKEKLRDAIEQSRGYVGINGIFRYSSLDHSGLSKESIVIYQAEGGNWRMIE